MVTPLGGRYLSVAATAAARDGVYLDTDVVAKPMVVASIRLPRPLMQRVRAQAETAGRPAGTARKPSRFRRRAKSLMDTNRRSVLVVVDVQRGFIKEDSQHVVPVIVDLVKRWSEHGGDIVFTRYLNHPGSPFERLMHWSRLMDSPETDLVPEIQPYTNPPAIVLDKPIYSLFTESGTQLVEARGWSDLYICGIATEGCVLKTAVDAFEKNLTPWLLTDASASHAGPAAHEAGLLVAARFIGKEQLINSADIPGIATEP